MLQVEKQSSPETILCQSLHCEHEHEHEIDFVFWVQVHVYAFLTHPCFSVTQKNSGLKLVLSSILNLDF